MPANIPALSLKFNEFKPTVFTPTQYATVAYDGSILPKSLEKQYNWLEKADAQVDAYRAQLDKIRSGLNPAEYKWFDEFSKQSLSKIHDEIEAGNTESAIYAAKQAARNIIDDTDLKNKIEYNLSREKAINTIESRKDINDDVRKAAKLLNTYNYNGNPEYTLAFDPVSSKSMAQIAATVASLTPEYSGTTARNNRTDFFLDNKGNITQDVSKAVYDYGSKTDNKSYTYHEKDPARLKQMFYDIIQSDSDINSALKQQFDVADILMKDAIKRSNDLSLTDTEREQALAEAEKYKNELTDKEGFTITNYNSWLERKALPIITSMAYKNISDSRTDITDYNTASIKAYNKDKNEKETIELDDDDKNVRGGVVSNYDSVEYDSWLEYTKSKHNAVDDAYLFAN